MPFNDKCQQDSLYDPEQKQVAKHVSHFLLETAHPLILGIGSQFHNVFFFQLELVKTL